MWKERIRKFWPLATLALVTSAASGFAYQKVAGAECCAPGAACCKPGAACCAKFHHNHAEAAPEQHASR